MRMNLGSLLVGGLLVAGGFLLARGPSWVATAQAGVAADINGWVVTTEDAVPGRIFVWATSGSALRSVTVHDCDRVQGTVTSRKIEPAPLGAPERGR